MIKSVMDRITPHADRLDKDYEYFWSANSIIEAPYQYVQYFELRDFFHGLFCDRSSYNVNFGSLKNRVIVHLTDIPGEPKLYFYKIKREDRKKLEKEYRDRDNKYIETIVEADKMLFEGTFNCVKVFNTFQELYPAGTFKDYTDDLPINKDPSMKKLLFIVDNMELLQYIIDDVTKYKLKHGGNMITEISSGKLHELASSAKRLKEIEEEEKKKELELFGQYDKPQESKEISDDEFKEIQDWYEYFKAKKE